MPLIFIFVAILVIFIILTIIIIGGSPQETEPSFAYSKNFSLLSSTEKAFLETLEPLLAESFRVFIKVRLADLIQIKPQQQKGVPREALSKIGTTTVDFVICSARDFAIVGIFDLENKAHSPSDQDMADEFIDKAAAAAQLPLVRMPAQLHYNGEEIAALLKNNFKLPGQTKDKATVSQYGDCPTCGEPLTLLKAKYGENIGKFFLGCSNYPECKYLSLLNDGDAVSSTDRTG